MSNKKKYSEHFIRFAINGEKFDFDAFKTQEEFEQYKKELEEFLNDPNPNYDEVFKHKK